MEFAYYTQSKAFQERPSPFDPNWAQFYSIKGRFQSLFSLIKKLAILPFALLAKGAKTFFRLMGFSFSIVTVLVTLGKSSTFRRFLEKRAHRLSLDLVDWIFYPLALTICVAKHVLAILVHPKIHYSL